MASSRVNWSSRIAAFTLAIAGDGSSPTLKNLSTGAGILGGTAYDNKTNKEVLWAFQLRVRGATAFIAGESVLLYLVSSLDDTNYEDGGTSVQPAREPDVIFTPRLVSTQQVITVRDVVVSPVLFKPLIWNASARSFTNTDNENQLHFISYASQADEA